jgi:hypothetical protein
MTKSRVFQRLRALGSGLRPKRQEVVKSDVKRVLSGLMLLDKQGSNR